MTAYETIQRVAAAMMLAVLVILAMAPVASAQTEQRHGWERTTVSTGRPDGGELTQSGGPTAPADGLRGWEATGVATGTQPTTSNDRPVTTTPQPISPSPTLLYVAAIVAALAMAFGTARLLRSPGKVA